MPAYLSLKIHHVGHPLFNLHHCYLPKVSCLSDEACTHRVRVDCYLFNESSSCRRSFLTGRLLSSSAVLYVTCSSIAFFTNSWARSTIQKRFRFPYRMHIANELKQQVFDVRLCLLAISLTTRRFNDDCKEVLHYFPDLFYVICIYSP